MQAKQLTQGNHSKSEEEQIHFIDVSQHKVQATLTI